MYKLASRVGAPLALLTIKPGPDLPLSPNLA